MPPVELQPGHPPLELAPPRHPRVTVAQLNITRNIVRNRPLSHSKPNANQATVPPEKRATRPPGTPKALLTTPSNSLYERATTSRRRQPTATSSRRRRASFSFRFFWKPVSPAGRNYAQLTSTITKPCETTPYHPAYYPPMTPKPPGIRPSPAPPSNSPGPTTHGSKTLRPQGQVPHRP